MSHSVVSDLGLQHFTKTIGDGFKSIKNGDSVLLDSDLDCIMFSHF